MRVNSNLVISLTVFSLLILLLSKTAYAYIDPGTGSMMLQALLAVVAAVSVSIGIFWRRIRLFFNRFLERNKDE
jgi:hypothetical protein